MTEIIVIEENQVTARESRLIHALNVARAALEHDAPEDCWATGPLTGDPVQDLNVCPGCQAIKEIDASITNACRFKGENEYSDEEWAEIKRLYGGV